MKAAASSNLKKVTLELGGKSPNIIFEDADLDQAVKWAAFGIFFNHGQCCCAGSRVFIQESIYDKFMEKLIALSKSIAVGDPFKENSFQGPQVSQLQYDRIMAHIEEGKKTGKLALGGSRKGTEGESSSFSFVWSCIETYSDLPISLFILFSKQVTLSNQRSSLTSLQTPRLLKKKSSDQS